MAEPLLTRRFDEALSYASSLHRLQLRKGGSVPYVSHLLGVASLVLEHGGDEEQAIAALLHDAVEDQGGAPTLEAIRQRFGDGVAEIVHACSERLVSPEPPWRERKQAYLAHLSGSPPRALLVAAADKLHNARSILADYRVLGETLWERFSAGREGALWYLRAVLEAFRGRYSGPLVEELERTVSELERIAAP